jgi:hypothetical protein
MFIWKPESVEVAPEVSLRNWRIIETTEGTRHFVGRNIHDDAGRVSSEIVEFDPVSRRGRTRSGRIYELVGQSGYDPDAAYVWQWWCTHNSVVGYTDVSHMAVSEDGDDDA